MNAYSINPEIFSALYDIVLNKVGKDGIMYIDVDGCLMPQSEHVRAQAYALLLDEALGILPLRERTKACVALVDKTMGKTPENIRIRSAACVGLVSRNFGNKKEISEKDVSIVHDLFAGPPVDVTVANIKETLHMEESLESILEEHDILYAALVKDKDQMPNPYIVKLIKLAQENGIRRIYLSNGRENGIKIIFKKIRIKESDDTIYAYDSERRKIDGKKERDKIKYFSYVMEKAGISPQNSIAFEDNAITAEGLGKLGGSVVYVYNGTNKRYVPPSTNIRLDCVREAVRPAPVGKTQEKDAPSCVPKSS